ncbi:hypothetical protein TI39_contig348g00002 [Zymoseptoria brevis]|uniref:Uncharacterized protein n=1 Tax=Zymoseptoria brevis TaxID=1047168 RepID=A0A0F4GRM3_9PEZI|nr:hypothetical protein TI39_contig348g00002 [Zymoseptoria brevis]
MDSLTVERTPLQLRPSRRTGTSTGWCLEISLLPAQDKKWGTKKTVTEVPEELNTMPARFPREDSNYAFSCALFALFMIKPICELFDTPGLVGWERLFDMQTWTSVTQPPDLIDEKKARSLARFIQQPIF